MSAAAEKFQRWVDLLATLLGRHSVVPFEDIIREVPGYGDDPMAPSAKRAFERDKKELRELGVPIETVGEEGDDDAAYRLSPKSFYLPYLGVQTDRGLAKPRKVDRYGYRALSELAFGAEELEAVAAAAHRVRLLDDPALVADVNSATRKLAFELPLDAAAQRAEGEVMVRRPLMPANPETLRALSVALTKRKQVELEYYSMTENAVSRRVVEPYGLFFVDSHWYLAANDGGKVRNFRVSRVRGCTPNGERPNTPDYEIPASFRLREHAGSKRAWELGADAAVEVTVELRGATGATVAAAKLGQPVKGKSNQRRFSVRRQDVFVRWLLSFAGEMVPIDPPAICEAYRTQVGAIRALYE